VGSEVFSGFEKGFLGDSGDSGDGFLESKKGFLGFWGLLAFLVESDFLDESSLGLEQFLVVLDSFDGFFHELSEKVGDSFTNFPAFFHESLDNFFASLGNLFHDLLDNFADGATSAIRLSLMCRFVESRCTAPAPTRAEYLSVGSASGIFEGGTTSSVLGNCISAV